MGEIKKYPECGRSIFPPDKQTNLEKAIDMLQDRTCVHSNNPVTAGAVAEFKALEADQKRLEWLVEHTCTHIEIHTSEGIRHLEDREAIDAAMKEAEGGT